MIVLMIKLAVVLGDMIVFGENSDGRKPDSKCPIVQQDSDVSN
jgi:hypothetical protein